MRSPGFESADAGSCQPLMNADGLYLLCYCALLLNLKLCCCDYYRRRTLASGLGLVSPEPLTPPPQQTHTRQFDQSEASSSARKIIIRII